MTPKATGWWWLTYRDPAGATIGAAAVFGPTLHDAMRRHQRLRLAPGAMVTPTPITSERLAKVSAAQRMRMLPLPVAQKIGAP